VDYCPYLLLKGPSKEEIWVAAEILHTNAGVPYEEIKGFRDPFLEWDKSTFSNLFELGFQYENTILERIGFPFTPSAEDRMWPYTLDYSYATICWTGPCDRDQKYPGFWVIPMWYFERKKDKQQLYLEPMDPIPGDNNEVFKLFQEHLLQRYNGNRAPFGIWLHPSWLSDGRAEVLHRFIEWARRLPDVWFVTGTQLIEYMKSPVNLRDIKNFAPLQCPNPEVAPNTSSKGTSTGLQLHEAEWTLTTGILVGIIAFVAIFAIIVGSTMFKPK